MEWQGDALVLSLGKVVVSWKHKQELRRWGYCDNIPETPP